MILSTFRQNTSSAFEKKKTKNKKKKKTFNWLNSTKENRENIIQAYLNVHNWLCIVTPVEAQISDDCKSVH